MVYIMHQSLLCFLAFVDKVLLYTLVFGYGQPFLLYQRWYRKDYLALTQKLCSFLPIIAFFLSVVFMPFEGFAFQSVREETYLLIVVPFVVSCYIGIAFLSFLENSSPRAFTIDLVKYLFTFFASSSSCSVAGISSSLGFFLRLVVE
ncbi:hypothetical protein OUZ56_021492 [Daphnia magna]|uniref:Uncharacterized protein n=1 Tax=Daphnia magna TaxID=35525 RepID=A0ABQ9ZHI8_9CRUS|nr:hypothetical protein OUZ56_021492 [Daphnia magna]